MSDLAAVPLLQPIGWALLHSLWQGAVLALLAMAALRSARHRSAEFRYAIASGSLGLMAAAFLVTLAWLSANGGSFSAVEVAPITPDTVTPVFLGWTNRLQVALRPWIPGLFLAWLLGFSLRLVLLGRSVAWLYGPCLKSLRPAPEAWMRRFEALRITCGVRTKVRLGLSDQVDSLVVLGWLKPVVMVPAAALMHLPPEGLEALLAHELAHVRRGDFLANLMQSLAEALLFYHPAVWWLSRRIRQEREHCCDDAAVRTCGDPILYASALARLEELRIQPSLVPDLAPAASGGKLMSRIQRLLRPRIAHINPAPLAALLPALLLVGALGAASLRATAADGPTPPSQPVEMKFNQIRIKHQPDPPAYPAEAKAARIQGTVVVVLTIDTAGLVTEAKAISGPPELQTCAVDYAKGWTFEPAKVKGKVVPARFKLTMPFRLR